MSVSMVGDAGAAGDGAGPGDPSSAAPSPASASGVAKRRRRLPVVTPDRPFSRRAFFRCVIAEYDN